MRWLMRLVSGLIMLALVAVGLVMLIPREEIARRAALQVQAMTGRELVIEGPVSASVWPGIAVSTGPVRLANADWAEAAPMVEAEGLRIALDTAALIGGEIRITGLELDAPQIRLERHRDGRANWDLLPSGGGGATGGTGQGIALAEARVRQGRVSYADHGSGLRQEVAAIEARLRLPGMDQPVELSGTARVNGQPVALDLSAAPASALLAGSGARGKVALVAGGSRLDFDGEFGHAPPRAEGALHLDAADPGALAALGAPVPALRLDGRVVATPDRVTLRDAVLAAAGSRLRLGADLALSGKPRLEATVSAEAPVTLSSGGGGGAGTGGGWSTERIDLSALHLLDADVQFSLPGLNAGPLRLGTMRGRLALDDGRAVVTLTELAAYQGRLTGTVVANARGTGSLRADLAIAGLALQPLLRDLAGQDRLIAPLNGRVSLLSSAASVDAMMRGLQGEGQVSLGKGELRGLDLLGMLRRLDPGHVGEGQKTIFDSIATGFRIAEGVLRADDLRLSAPWLRAEGKGVIGIGTRTLDYRIVPVALQKEDGSGGVTVPLRISGPWSGLRYQLDLEALAKPKIDAEKARLEARAKAELARKAEEKLGIVAGEGERLEDAAKRRLEQEVLKGLGRILGGN